MFNPNPSFQTVALTDNSASSHYEAMQLKFQRRLASGLQVLASYVLSHSIDNASTDAFATYLNTPGAMRSKLDRRDSDFDIRHAFTSGATYDLPDTSLRGAGRAMLHGWSLAALIWARSAPPVDVVEGLAVSNGTILYARPNVKSGVPIELDGAGYPGGKVFSSAAFAAAPAGEQGNLGRNVLRGFPASQADVALQRLFRVTEKTGLRVRAEFFNLLNHPNFGSLVNDLASPLFGRSTQTLANSLGAGGASGGESPLYQVGGPRSIQLAAKLQF